MICNSFPYFALGLSESVLSESRRSVGRSGGECTLFAFDNVSLAFKDSIGQYVKGVFAVEWRRVYEVEDQICFPFDDRSPANVVMGDQGHNGTQRAAR